MKLNHLKTCYWLYSGIWEGGQSFYIMILCKYQATSPPDLLLQREGNMEQRLSCFSHLPWFDVGNGGWCFVPDVSAASSLRNEHRHERRGAFTHLKYIMFYGSLQVNTLVCGNSADNLIDVSSSTCYYRRL